MAYSGYYTGTSGKQSYARLIPVKGGYRFESSYHPALVQGMKDRIPSDGRTYDPTTKTWTIAAEHIPTLVDIVKGSLGMTMAVPALPQAAPVTKIIEVHYIGRCKERGGDDPSALGTDGSRAPDGKPVWGYVFPEPVLREWDDPTYVRQPKGSPASSKPTRALDLYAVLSLKRSPPPTDDDIRSAYRQLARHWHPDVCKEPDAAAQFIKIKNAYETLKDEPARRRYNAGLAFEAAAAVAPATTYRAPVGNALDDSYGYRSSRRCGYVLVTGRDMGGRFVVDKIMQWQDISRSDGAVMSTSWPAGAFTYDVAWVGAAGKWNPADTDLPF